MGPREKLEYFYCEDVTSANQLHSSLLSLFTGSLVYVMRPFYACDKTFQCI